MFGSLTSLSRRAVVVPMFLGVIGVSGVLLPNIGAATQEQDRVVTKLRRRPMPVDIKVIKTKKGVVGIGRKFSDEDDWFKGLTVRVENTSGKTITYIGGGFLFPSPTDQGVDKETPLSYRSFMYGHHPQAPDEAYLTQPTISVKPGEIFNVTISDSDYNWVKQRLAKLGYPASIKEIRVNFEEIFFDDGSAWIAGSWYQRDSNDPQKYNQVGKLRPANKANLRIEQQTLSRSSKQLSVIFSLRNLLRVGQMTDSLACLYFLKPFQLLEKKSLGQICHRLLHTRHQTTDRS